MEFDDKPTVTVGQKVDTYYEYLIKQFIQNGRQNSTE